MAAFILCRALLGLLKHKSDEEPLAAGTVTSAGLLIAGLAIFFIDFFRLPSELLPNALLDPSQIIGTAMILIGGVLLTRTQTQVERESGIEPPHAI